MVLLFAILMIAFYIIRLQTPAPPWIVLSVWPSCLPSVSSFGQFLPAIHRAKLPWYLAGYCWISPSQGRMLTPWSRQGLYPCCIGCSVRAQPLKAKGLTCARTPTPALCVCVVSMYMQHSDLCVFNICYLHLWCTFCTKLCLPCH